jgi:hypothetical protein
LEEGGGDGSDEDEDDVNDELALPDVLSNLSWKEKKELLAYKRAHTDVRGSTCLRRRLSVSPIPMPFDLVLSFSRSDKYSFPCNLSYILACNLLYPAMQFNMIQRDAM